MPIHSSQDISSGFRGDLVTKLRKYHVEGKWFKLEEDFVYYSKGGRRFVIPRGINTDFASVPRGLRWLIPRVGDHGMAAVFHDWIVAAVINRCCCGSSECVRANVVDTVKVKVQAYRCTVISGNM